MKTVFALLTWSRWHDSLPVVCYSEEFCEASLAKLGKLCNGNPNMVTIQELQHLFLRVPATDSTPKDLPGGQVGYKLVDKIKRNLHLFICQGHRVITYVPWKAGKTYTAKEE